MDEKALSEYLKQKESESEDRCSRCGACCGAHDGDPCVHLKTDGQNSFYCDTYELRLGKQRTVSGREFTCVSIKEVLVQGTPKNPQCAYI